MCLCAPRTCNVLFMLLSIIHYIRQRFGHMHVDMEVCVCLCVCLCENIPFVYQLEKRLNVQTGLWACLHTSVRKRGCPCVCYTHAQHRVSMRVCMYGFGVSVCAWMCPPPPVPPCAVGSAGNVTPVPGIAASLDPGNSDDRNRRLLPLRRTHCLATGSPHTRPKPFLKASSSFAAVPACLLFLPLLLFLLIISKCPFVPFETLSSSHGLLLFLLFLPLAH